MRVSVQTEDLKSMPEKVKGVINLLQAAIVLKDLDMVKLIIQQLSRQSFDAESMLDYELNFLPENKEKIFALTNDCLWIVQASAIHIATFWHAESLAFLLKSKPELGNRCTPNYKMAPIHIASLQDNCTIIRLLIYCNVDIESQTAFGHTALHIAAMSGHVNNVMMLVFEGRANVLAKSNICVRSDCRLEETPIHHAKTGKIIRILLSKTTAKQLMEIDTIEDRPLFNQFLKHDPSTLKSYLDLMVTSKNDLESEDPHLIYDLSMFDYRQNMITKKKNQMDKHLRVMEERQSELLTHPVMKLFMDLKWHPNVVPNLISFLVFFMFLAAFTAHGLRTVDFLQCDNLIGSSG